MVLMATSRPVATSIAIYTVPEALQLNYKNILATAAQIMPEKNEKVEKVKCNWKNK